MRSVTLMALLSEMGAGERAYLVAGLCGVGD